MESFCYFAEQFEILNKMIQDQSTVASPLLSDDALSQLDYIVNQKLEFNKICTVEYWQNGYIITYTDSF